MTCSGWPVKRLRSTGSWVATPTGQVLRWHLRIMMQPAAIRGAVAKPRRRDQSDAGRRMPHTRDNGVDLVAGQLSAFAGFCALRHLDLHHVGVDEIFGGDAEAARGDLLDRRAHRIAVRHRLEAIAFLAALSGIGLSAGPGHPDPKRGGGPPRGPSARPRARRKTLD